MVLWSGDEVREVVRDGQIEMRGLADKLNELREVKFQYSTFLQSKLQSIVYKGSC